MNILSNWRKKASNKNTIGTVPLLGNPQYDSRVQFFITDIQQKFSTLNSQYDFIGHSVSTIVTAGGYVLRLTIPAAFVNPPEVHITNAERELIPGLDAMSRSGLIDGDTGKFRYQKIFGFSNDMAGSTFVFLVAVALRSAAITAVAIVASEDTDSRTTITPSVNKASEIVNGSPVQTTFTEDDIPLVYEGQPHVQIEGGNHVDQE